MKKLTVLMMFMMLGLCSLVSAGERIGVVANSSTNTIQLINPEDNSISPPFEDDFRRYGGNLFDMVITSNGKTAIVSNFGASRIFFICLCGGFANPPTLLGSTPIGMFAEDMVITPDDRYVLVADGGSSSRVAVVEIATRQLKRLNNLGSRYAQAIDITPDGQTVLVADYSGMAVHAYTLDYTTGILTRKKTVRIRPFMPVNIAISPDGRTVIASIAGFSACVILYFDTAGELHYRGPIAMPSRNGQSCVFTKDGTKAYYLSNSQNKGTLVHILNVTGPGLVSPSGTSIKIWPKRGTSQLFGVDTIAMDPGERYLYVTNPTVSGGIADVAIVDLETNTQVGYIPTCGIPTGIAFTTIDEDDGDAE